MQQTVSFDYFYGGESEQFSYYRIPRLLVTGPQFKNLSTDAKLLYGLMLDRMSLSAKNGWYDQKGRVYMGYDLTAKLLKLSASGSGNTYTAGRNSSVAKKMASDKGFTNNVMNNYNSGVDGQSDDLSYAFPVSQGDLGAALHCVSYTYKTITDGTTGKQCLLVTATDTFDFTEMKNPLTQGSIKAGFLWLANDIASTIVRIYILSGLECFCLLQPLNQQYSYQGIQVTA